MIRQLPYGNIIAGVLIMISGLLVLVPRSLPLVFAERLLLLFALWYLLPALMIQLLQGGSRPYLGWLGVLLILVYLLSYALLSPNAGSGGWDPFAGGSPFVLVGFLLLLVAPAAAFVLVGISMKRSGYFPQLWGYAVALPEGAAACYTEDGIGEYWETFHGRKEISEVLSVILSMFSATSHHLTNTNINLDDDQATAMSYVYAFHRMANTDEPLH